MKTGLMLALVLGLAVPVLAGDMDKGKMEAGMEAKMSVEPALGGHCAFALAKKGMLKAGDAMYSTKVGDKTYYCSSAEAHAAFMKDPEALAKKAEKVHMKMMKKKKKMEMKEKM